MTETIHTKIGIQSDSNNAICPECGKEHIPNAVTIAAMREVQDMIDGKTPVKWYKSIEEARQGERLWSAGY